jgi:hypothetical protein
MIETINNTKEFKAWSGDMQTRIEDVLNAHLTDAKISTMRLHESMRYYT